MFSDVSVSESLVKYLFFIGFHPTPLHMNELRVAIMRAEKQIVSKYLPTFYIPKWIHFDMKTSWKVTWKDGFPDLRGQARRKVESLEPGISL